MSEIQRIEEENYNVDDSTWRTEMIADSEDPGTHAFECPFHGQWFVAPDTCSECPTPDPNRQPDFCDNYTEADYQDDLLF